MNYPVEAKKNLANFSVVLDTPEYNRVTELKSHMSNVSRRVRAQFHKWLGKGGIFFICLTSQLFLCLSQMIYKAHSKAEMSKVTTPANALDLQRAKWAQQLTNKASLRRRSPLTVCFYVSRFASPDRLLIACVPTVHLHRPGG